MRVKYAPLFFLSHSHDAEMPGNSCRCANASDILQCLCSVEHLWGNSETQALNSGIINRRLAYRASSARARSPTITLHHKIWDRWRLSYLPSWDISSDKVPGQTEWGRITVVNSQWDRRCRRLGLKSDWLLWYDCQRPWMAWGWVASPHGGSHRSSPDVFIAEGRSMQRTLID